MVSGIEKGNRLPTVPKFQAAVAATYRWEAGDWAGYLSSAFQHVGSRFTQIGDHAPGFGTVDLLALSATNPIGGPLTQSVFRFDPEMPAYNLMNLRLGFLGERWDIALFINNATDERAFLALDQERGTRARVGYLTNPPRTIGVSSRIQFWSCARSLRGSIVAASRRVLSEAGGGAGAPSFCRARLSACRAAPCPSARPWPRAQAGRTRLPGRRSWAAGPCASQAGSASPAS